MRSLIAIACLLFIISGCSPAPAAPATVEPLPVVISPQSAPTDTSSPLLATLEQPTIPPLETYRSTAFGYTFLYPVTSSLEASSDGFLVWVDQQVSIEVSSQDPAALANIQVESTDSTFINGQVAQRVSGIITLEGSRQRFERLTIARAGRFYSITLYELRRDVVSAPDRIISDIPLTARSLFDTVVGTFTMPN